MSKAESRRLVWNFHPKLSIVNGRSSYGLRDPSPRCATSWAWVGDGQRKLHIAAHSDSAPNSPAEA